MLVDGASRLLSMRAERGTYHLRAMPPILTLSKISKRFGAVVVADGVDLALAQGEALGIIGPNGAGKTTLFGIMTGTVPPDAGRVFFDGQDITHAAPERRCRRGIARSFQVPQPFGGMTVFENLVVAAAFGSGQRERDVYARCATLLEQCALADKANRQAGSLTLLDRKRLELARALATGPRLLLLDEVMAGLNQAEVGIEIDLLRSLHAEGLTFLIIEHNLKVVRAFSERVFVLDRGKLIAEGTADQILNSAAVIEAYLGAGHVGSERAAASDEVRA